MRRVALMLALFAIVAPLGWIGGELHRENCQHEGRVGCSVLPWSNGHSKDGGWGSAAGTARCEGNVIDCVLK